MVESFPNIDAVLNFLEDDTNSAAATFWLYAFDPTAGFSSPRLTRSHTKAVQRVKTALARSSSGPAANTRAITLSASAVSLNSLYASSTATAASSTTVIL